MIRVGATTSTKPPVGATGVDESASDLHIRGVRVAQAARIAVLGPLRIGGVQPRITPRDRVVLEALSIRVGDNVTTDWLADALWGDTPPASAAKNLQGCIARLRKAWATTRSRPPPRATAWRCLPSDVDSHAFEHLVQRARELLALREPDRAAYVVDEALGLFNGEPLEDLIGWDLGMLEAERLREVRSGRRGAARRRPARRRAARRGTAAGAGAEVRAAAARTASRPAGAGSVPLGGAGRGAGELASAP